MSNSNDYETLRKFVDEKIEEIKDTSTQPVLIPDNILNAINKEVERKRSSRVNNVARDIIVRKVYELEYSRRLEELQDVINGINSSNKYLSKELIGSEIQNDNHDFNLKFLMEDIYRLPKFNHTHENSKNAGNEDVELKKTLKEYEILREELINHCDAIKLGEIELNSLESQINKVDNLKTAIKQQYKGNNDEIDDETLINDYINNYHENLESELTELAYNLEEQIKTLDSSDKEKRKYLVNLIDELNI